MKTCPTCGARAFDDAEVCYGCLHRYETIASAAMPGKLNGGASEDRKVDSLLAAASGQQTGSVGYRALAAPGAVSVSTPSEGERSQIRSNSESQPGCAPAAPTPPRIQTGGYPESGAGWTVRFELPGYAPVLESSENESGFVVRFQPETAKGSLGHRSVRVAHGTHARDAPVDGRSLATSSERS